MPPMTVVEPSLTRTEVCADWVLIGGTAARRCRPRGRSRATCCRPPPAGARCPPSVMVGVTLRESTGVLEGHGDRAVGDRLVGSCTPCLISAATLFWVVMRGVEMMRALPGVLGGGERRIQVEAAQDVAHRDADAGVLRRGGEVHHVAAARRPDAHRPRRPPGAPCIGRSGRPCLGRPGRSRDRSSGRCRFPAVSEVRTLPVQEAPLDAEVAREVAGGDHDPGLDLHLWRGPVQLGDEAPWRAPRSQPDP